MRRIVKYASVAFALVAFFSLVQGTSISPEQESGFEAGRHEPVVEPAPPDTIPYPFEDEGDDPFTENQSPLFLKLPTNISSQVEYDPVTGRYVFSRKIGDLNYRMPYSMTYQEYQDYLFDKQLREYWRQRLKNENFQSQERSFLNPQLRVPGEVFDRIFGSNTIDIKPQGSAELIFGVNISNIENPALPRNLQRSVTFDYQQKIQMGVKGKIGDKLDLGINYNTEATFDFENQTKIGYEGKEDEIIQSIEAGNVSLPLTGSLITGSHSLFGFKTALQFGKLTMTSIFSQQKGETKVIEIEGGAQVNEFEISADEYEANKHFFLSQYFRDNFDRALSSLPVIQSGVNITRIEVWVTNKTGDFDEARNIVGFMDLGEGIKAPYNDANQTNIYADDFISLQNNTPYPHNGINTLYEEMTGTYSGIRDIGQVTSILGPLDDSYDFQGGQDYEKIENARLLDPSEYTFNPKLGYVSLNSALNSDEVLAVAYEYTVNGEVYRVGEFSNGAVSAPEALIVKLLKGTNLTPKLPTWDLMMKNIYSIGAYQVNNEDFRLDVLYYDVENGTKINYIPAGDINRKILLRVMNLDNLNSQLDPQPDGRFDFIDRVTINSDNGRIIFPVAEPFGSHLREKITGGDPALDPVASRYVFEELYDSTQNKAQQIAEKNKFYLEGSYRSSSGSEIPLNAMNIPQGSVKVTANGRPLTEGQDYIVDYQLGRVTILNQGLLESGTPIRISLENQAMFNIGTKTLIGTHFDYKFSDDFRLGATVLNLTERPLTNKVNFGDEPISNTIWGVDGSYYTEAPFLTRLVDKIPFIDTKEKSSLTIEGEFAHLIPGTSGALEGNGVSYIDDFEGSKTTIDLKTPSAWVLASTPQGQPGIFPEGSLSYFDLAYGYNRARLAWYNVLSDLVRNTSATPDHLRNDPDQQSNHFVREVFEQDLFPNRQSETGYPNTLPVLNLSFYPTERGPYNYDVAPSDYSAGINSDGELNSPDSRWGGIMRRIQSNDFESANIEFIEFWLMDPFVYDDQHEGGELYINLGNISEDILRDSRKMFENGLPADEQVEMVDTTIWGRVPIRQSLVNAFDNDPESREYQDVGLDGLDDDDERIFFSQQSASEKSFAFLDSIETLFSRNSLAYQKAYEDPSSDNYHFFKGGDYDDQELSILERYKQYNGLEGNSPTDEQNPEDYPTSGSLLPDVEDINLDNTLSENESYYQYRIKITPEDMVVGENYITDVIYDANKRKNDKIDTVRWYQFKIPIYEPDQTIGSIQDFKSIRFIRMFLKNFEESVHLRFAKLDLVRGEWRKYNYDLTQAHETWNAPQQSDAGFDISAVNIEENANRTPVNYVLPPGVSRVIDPNNPQMRELNEQAIVMKVNGLEDGDARAAYRNVNLDVRQYKTLQMWIHAEKDDEDILNDRDLTAFIRLGTDYKENYYEYEIPLEVTPEGRYNNDFEADRRVVWPLSNRLDINFEIFQRVKQERNNAMRNQGSTVTMTTPFMIMDGKNRVRVIGNPNLADVRTIMIGVRNPEHSTNPDEDDGLSKSGEIWMNELRLTDFNQEGGWAANARVSAKLADFATITVAANTSTPGFGSIEKKVNERSKEQVMQYDISSNFELGKFFPKHFGVKMPLYVGFSEGFVNPQYNPLDPDIPLDVSLNNPELSQADRDSIRFYAQDYTQRKSINLTNIRIDPKKRKDKDKDKKDEGKTDAPTPPSLPGGGRPGGGNQPSNKKHFYSLSNWSFTYSYNEIFRRDVNTEYDLTKQHYGAINYTFTHRPKNIQPFRKINFLKAKPLQLIRDFNFYLSPTQLSFRTDMSRQYNAVQLRNISNPYLQIEPNYRKDFVWNRDYSLKYNITKDLKFDFTAKNVARIDEPEGWLDADSADYSAKMDTIWENIMNLGRTTHYNHRFDVTWRLPINKLPLLDWVNANAKYSATYSWDAGPITADTIELGNTVKNTNTMQINGQLNLKTLYNKAGFLKRANQRFSGRGKKKEMEDVRYEQGGVRLKTARAKTFTHKLKTEEDIKITVTDPQGQQIFGEIEIVNENKVRFIPDNDVEDAKVVITGKREKHENIFKFLGQGALRLMMSVQNISLAYSENNGSMLPGYMPGSHLLGTDNYNGVTAPGWEYLLGWQNENFGENAAYNGWITKDSLLNAPYNMTHNTSLNFRSTIEPVNDLRIDVSANRSHSTTMSEYYLADANGNFQPNNLRYSGNFTMSYFTINTAFWGIGSDYSSKAFDNFLAYRQTVARRLANRRTDPAYDPNATYINPENGEEIDFGDYPSGYSELSQDVLLPSLLAAYSDRDPATISLEPFPKIPMPNWRLKYDGLSKLEFFKKYFKKISINHSYKSSYNIGSYQSNPFFDFDPLTDDGLSYVRNEVSGLFIPEYEINSVTISEQFSPLINVDLTWNNSLTTRLEYRQSRDLSLSLSNNQLVEMASKEFIFGGGYKIKALPIIINKDTKFESDLDLRADFSLRDMITIIRKIEEGVDQVTAGQTNISIKFTADYRLNESFNLRLFYDQVINNPKISTSFRTSNTKFGISIRFTLIPK